jgi:hypothetical protein
MTRIVFAAILVSACASTSQQAARDQYAQTSSDDEIVCVDQPRTGSLMSREVCHTRADWQAQHDDTLQFMQHPRAMYGH